MMSQDGALGGLFGDDAFFLQEQLLWPRYHGSLAPLTHDFFSRRTKMADSLLRELQQEPYLLTLGQVPFISSSLDRIVDGEQQRESSRTELQKPSEDFLVTLDARGYSPNDIRVNLEGRSLTLAAMKQAGAEESQSCSSSSRSSSSLCSSSSSKSGFVQKIALPAHLDLSRLRCSLMDDGQLRVNAPAAKQEVPEGLEPTRFRTSLMDDGQLQVHASAAKQEVTEGLEPTRFRASLEFPITKDMTEEGHTD